MERRETNRLFVIGGTGFVGVETIRQAVARGWEVRALVRSDGKAERVRALGATPVLGDAGAPDAWVDAARGASALVDLVQPELPGRIGTSDIEAVSRQRQTMTRALLSALDRLPPHERPLLVSVSGTDDLAPGPGGRIDERSPLKEPATGFGRIGIPVRRIVEAAATPAAFLYLGTVYGPGKSFATTVFPRLASGRFLVARRSGNQFPLIHVEDVARAIVHLLGLGTDRLAGTSWILVDEAGGSPLGAFFDEAARLMGVAPPRRVPGWLLSLFMGRPLFETFSRDLTTGPGALLATGFRFTYPTIRQGLPATLRELGYGDARSARPSAPVEERARGWRLLFAATLAALVGVNVLDLPLTVPRLRALAGGLSMLDTRPGYAPGDVAALFDALGAAGRESYLAEIWTVDLFLPALFGLFLFVAVGRGSLWRWRWLGPLAAFFDYLENATITLLLFSYPRLSGGVARLASALTVTKLALYLAALAAAVGGAWIRRRPAPESTAPPPAPHREANLPTGGSRRGAAAGRSGTPPPPRRA